MQLNGLDYVKSQCKSHNAAAIKRNYLLQLKVFIFQMYLRSLFLGNKNYPLEGCNDIYLTIVVMDSTLKIS